MFDRQGKKFLASKTTHQWIEIQILIGLLLSPTASVLGSSCHWLPLSERLIGSDRRQLLLPDWWSTGSEIALICPRLHIHWCFL